MCWVTTTARSCCEEATQERKFSSPVLFFIFGESLGDTSLKGSVCTEIKLQFSLYLGGAALVETCCHPTGEDSGANL